MLADLGCAKLVNRPGRVLIGGLGIGFTLRRVLEIVGAGSKVEVAELIPEVVQWNREFIGPTTGAPLKDRRVEVLIEDVFKVIDRAPNMAYDSMMLDVDNGPLSFVHSENSRIYTRRGFDRIWRALKPGGCVAFWSANPEPGFVRRLTTAGFKAREIEARSHDTAKRCAHRIYTAERPIRPVADRPADPDAEREKLPPKRRGAEKRRG